MKGLLTGVTACALAFTVWLATAPGSDGASIHGRVLDGRGDPVAEAIVSISKNGVRQGALLMTHADGAYSFPGLDAGVDYELRAEHDVLSSPVRLVRIPEGSREAAIDLTLAPPIQFRDDARHAGLNFTLRNGATGHFFQPEIMLGGVAAFDYNNDGCMDVFFVNGAELPSGIRNRAEFENRLYRNNCDMTFTDVTGKAGVAGEGYSMGVATADYDNDGFSDIFVTGLKGNALYRNRGDGTFENVTATAGIGVTDAKYGPMWSVSAGWFDYDNDGYLDLFVSSYVAWEPGSDSCSENGKPFYCHPRVYRPLPNRLFHNNRDGTFSDVSQPAGIARYPGKGMGIAFGDFNGDGFPDVFVANDSVPNFLFENQGDGTFREVAVARGVAYAFHGNAVAGMGADFRDFDDDGRDDIALTGMYFDTFPLYRNLGKPNFFVDATVGSGLAIATRNLTGWGLGMFDFDNDGHKDLFFAASHFPGSESHVHSDAAIPNHVLRNAGNGRFDDVSEAAGRDFQIPAQYHGAAFADFDNDGRIDAVVTAVNSYARLFRNTSSGSGHWLTVRLVGSRSNRDGLGAKVRLSISNGSPTNGWTQYNHATTAVGYASSSEPLVHFGLGPYQRVREVEIHWPSGRTQMLKDLAGDQVISVREPSQ
jgi:hypothetical protein